MNTQMLNRQSAAKTLHKPLSGFEYRYIIYSNGDVFDKFRNTYLKSFENKVSLVGTNNKSYRIPISKLLELTFGTNDFKDFVTVNNHPNYIISKTGSLYNIKSKRYISTTIKNGYIRYNVNWSRRNMHEVLADQFIPNPNNYNSIDHIDGDKLNNDLNNLEWCDIEENKKRAYYNGLTRVVKTMVTFIKDSDSFTILGLENASKIFGIKKSTLCTMIKRYGDKDIEIPNGSMKGYKIITNKCKCKVQRLSDTEQGLSELEMVDNLKVEDIV